jgi:hypothetical protein
MTFQPGTPSGDLARVGTPFSVSSYEEDMLDDCASEARQELESRGESMKP